MVEQVNSVKKNLGKECFMPKEVPIWEKSNLTLQEASMYFNIGINRLRQLTDDRNCSFVLWCGSKRLIKRRLFEDYLKKTYSI